MKLGARFWDHLRRWWRGLDCELPEVIRDFGVEESRLRIVKNIQVIDGAVNCVYDIYSATDEEFSLIFPSGTDILTPDVRLSPCDRLPTAHIRTCRTLATVDQRR